MKRVLLLILGLLAFGAAKLPFERRLSAEYHAAQFNQAGLNRDIREQAGQMGFIAAMSGFRAVVADMLWIRAHVAWQNLEWGRMKLLFDTVTSLAPRAGVFWDGAAHHMAWNASVAAMHDESKREALRVKASREYIRIGEEYYLRGIRFNPDDSRLYDQLGLLYQSRMKDHCKASWAYYEAAKRPHAMQYAHRVAVYELARCPGHEAEAYRQLAELYHRGKQERLPTLLKLIDTLQVQLNIPKEQRIDTSADWPEAVPR